MKLLLFLLLLSLIGLSVGQSILASRLGAESDVYEQRQQQQAIYQEPQEAAVEQAPSDRKTLGKRSLGWSSPWLLPSYGHELHLGHGLGYGHGLHGWPLYGHGLHGGLSLGWPVITIGHSHGWHGSGWHSKW